MALEGPPNDVALMANALQARGVRDANIERLVGGSATRQAFTDQLSAAIARTQCDDSMTIHLSTHGTGAFHGYNTLRRRDLNEPSAYFLLEDITPEAFSSAPPWGMISGTELESAVKALRARGAHIFVITDFIGGQAMQLDGGSGWHCCKEGERLHGSQGSIAVFAPGYAAEMTLPKNGPDRKRYGVFTFYLGVGLANPN